MDLGKRHIVQQLAGANRYNLIMEIPCTDRFNKSEEVLSQEVNGETMSTRSEKYDATHEQLEKDAERLLEQLNSAALISKTK